MRQRAAHRTVNLRHATQAIGVLNTRIVLEMRLPNFASLQKFQQMFCRCSLSRMWPGVLQTSIKRRGSTLERLEAHGTRNIRETGKPFRAKKCKSACCMHGLGAV